MSDFRPNLPAAEVHRNLRNALHDLARAERNAVIWFCEVQSRKLYRELGYSSIHQYASEELGFSQSKTYQFLQLAGKLQDLPKLRRSVSDGSVTWTKARAVAAVATAGTEERWVEAASSQGRRQLERSVREYKARVAAARKAPGQIALAAARNGAAGCAGGHSESVSGRGRRAEDRGMPASAKSADIAFDMPARVAFDLSATEFARYEALIEKLRKLGVKGSKTELLLLALDELVEERTDSRREARSDGSKVRATGDTADDTGGTSAPVAAAGHEGGHYTRVHSHSPYQVVVTVCPSCGAGEIPSTGGARPLTSRTLSTILCDARVQAPGVRNTASVPPRIRREVMARDRHRCRMKGCERARFLEVHHIFPREANGPNDPANLVTLCSGCHNVTHGMQPDVLSCVLKPVRRPGLREPIGVIQGSVSPGALGIRSRT